jgi:hypothetical protein
MSLSMPLLALVLLLGPVGAAPATAQINMPDPKEISGVPLPSPEVAAGALSVRVIRGDFSNNLPGQTVELTVDGEPRTAATDAEGRALFTGLRLGQRVQAVVVVDDERLVSQDITIGSTGLRVVLVATDPEIVARAAESARLAATPAVKGIVVMGPETRIIAELDDDRLSIFYVLEVVNAARVPVDIGGPLIFDLPRSARGTTMLDGSSPQATANGPRVIITGPFAPGSTTMTAAFELPTGGETARLVQRWPATLPQLTVLVPRVGNIDVSSERITSKSDFNSDGQQVIVGTGSTIPEGQTLELLFTGLPYHARWPRNVALTLAGIFVLLGIWGAVTARPRRMAA